VTFNAPTGAAQVSVPLTLAASAAVFSANVGAKLTLSGDLDLGNEQTLTTDGRGDIEVSGIIKGSSSSGIVKEGDGALILSGVNTYDGPVTVDQGALVAANSQALGSTAGGTFVNSGAALRVEGGVSIAENFVIRDVGVGLNLSSMGAVRSTGGNNTISGTITLGSSSGFGVDNGSTLTLSGPIMMAPSSDLAATDGGRNNP